jgi:hypothetical protein
MFSPQQRGNLTPLLGPSAPTPVHRPAPKALPKLQSWESGLRSRDSNDTPGGWSDTTTAPSRDEREIAQPLEAHTATAAQPAEGASEAEPAAKSAKKKKKTSKAKNRIMQEQNERNADLKVFVGGLSQETTRESLRAAFEQPPERGLGLPVLGADVLRDPDSERSRGFGFVEFNPKWTPPGKDIEVDFDLHEDFWKGASLKDGKLIRIIRIDKHDCGVYPYSKKSKGTS